MPLIPILNFKQNDNQGWKNVHYIHAAAIVWMLITVWLCEIYTPRPFSDDFLLYAIGLLGSGAFAMIFYLHIRPYPAASPVQREQMENAQYLFKKFGKSSGDYFRIYQDKQLFFGTRVKGFIAFKSAAGFAIVVDDPICGDDHDHKIILIREFERFCKSQRLSPCYYKVDKTSLSLFDEIGKKSMQIGREAIVNLQYFSLIDKKQMALRNAVYQIEKSGLQTKLHFPPLKNGLIQQLEMVSDEWIKTTGFNTLFPQTPFSPEEIRNHQVMTMENEEGKIVAFLNIIPGCSSEEITYDLIRKTNDAPTGVLDALIVKMIEYSKACGYQYLNMGLAPFSGIENSKNLPEKIIKLAYEKIPLFKSYHTQNDFSGKFDPQWQKQFLIYGRSYHLLLLPIAIKKIRNQNLQEIPHFKN